MLPGNQSSLGAGADRIGAVAKQVQRLPPGLVLDRQARAAKTRPTGCAVEVVEVDASGKTQVMVDLVQGGAEEVDSILLDPVGGIEVEARQQIAVEPYRCISRAGTDVVSERSCVRPVQSIQSNALIEPSRKQRKPVSR